jgi:L,D-peptidoglycan transpeptidase YkuD (ErfK/YbiS/YcfS/YnhG family)
MIKVTGNKLQFNGKTYQCAHGKAGFAAHKIEGDNCSPIGNFPLREVFYRHQKPETKLKTTKIEPNFGWCDDISDPNYNKFVKLPYSSRHEKLWRDDNLYDIIVVIGYNDQPPMPGKGSAIFMHIAKPEYQGTEGCIALSQEDLLEILKNSDEKTKIQISA